MKRMWSLISAQRRFLIVVAVIVVFFATRSVLAQELYEQVSFALVPSAARAFAYGDRHLNARNPGAYDIERAAHFFAEAQKLDSNYPYLNHQLARIAFLKGNFNTAMVLIDKEIALQGDAALSSYYARALIEGYMGRYDDAAKDYEHFLSLKPLSWAGLNDYAWVLLKAGRSADAARISERGLEYFPENPWLLNTSAIAQYETGNLKVALLRAKAGVAASEKLTKREWLAAYPGNDPLTALDGLRTLKTSAQDNMHTIEQALASSTVQ